jgi:AraC family transcriptional regulator of adaptative response/methylated-DNA-[protein]-cysteine methyltransferase
MTSVANAVEMDLEDSATYERMAEAIAFMRQHHRSQPDLKTIAQAVHLSEYHFQRVFTQWAGISPKRFLQYLTVEYAKGRIAETENLLSLTAEAGLSSPGRLHDLFVSLEAMSPGEYKAAGAGLSIRYGLHETPFGQCLIARTDRGICTLQFVEMEARPVTVEARLRDQWPAADLVWDPATTAELSDRIFQPRQSPVGPLVLHVKGTNFQIQVWRALLTIPFGGMTTYQGLATEIGRPTAARAIGNAVGRNPIGYLIPCHRVIRGSGELGGYRWGLARKTAMLGWEASHYQRESR